MGRVQGQESPAEHGGDPQSVPLAEGWLMSGREKQSVLRELTLRLTAEQYAAIQAAARADRKTVGDWSREVLLEIAAPERPAAGEATKQES